MNSGTTSDQQQTTTPAQDGLRPLRFWHQSMTELEGLDVYRRTLTAQAKEILGADGSIEITGVRAGSYHGVAPTDALANAFIYHRVLDQILDHAVQAERQGFDVFVIGSFSEPLLREIRSVVQIPVVSILESSMLVGCSLGKKIIPIANSPKVAFMVQSAIEKHALTGRVMPARAIVPAMDEPALALAFAHPQPVLDSFFASARKAIADGAEVIVPAEGVLASLLTRNGVRQIDGAPVLDVFALTWRYGVMLARLRDSVQMQVSMVGGYARGDQALIDALVN